MTGLNLVQTLIKEAVLLDCEPFKDKEELFQVVANRFLEAGVIKDVDAYIKSLEYRETLGSTYMGEMIGMPHGKCDEVVRPGIAFCRCKEPFIYRSNGEEGEVKYAFVLAIAGNQSGDDYMRVLASLAGLLVHEDFIGLLDKCQTYEELISNIQNYNN